MAPDCTRRVCGLRCAECAASERLHRFSLVHAAALRFAQRAACERLRPILLSACLRSTVNSGAQATNDPASVNAPLSSFTRLASSVVAHASDDRLQ
jgi:hypothetical protein